MVYIVTDFVLQNAEVNTLKTISMLIYQFFPAPYVHLPARHYHFELMHVSQTELTFSSNLTFLPSSPSEITQLQGSGCSDQN